MQSNYIQLTKGSLGSSPTMSYIRSGQTEVKEVNWFESCTPEELRKQCAMSVKYAAIKTEYLV